MNESLSISKGASVITRFREVSSVRGRNRAELADGTKEDYIRCLKQFHDFTGRKPAAEWTAQDVEAYMRHLRDEDYARSSRKQHLCAIVYVFKHVLCRDLGVLNLPPLPLEKRPIKIIPTREDLRAIFANLAGIARVMCGVMYGSGLRVGECCKLRVKDVDFSALTIRVHGGKGGKDRLCLLPEAMVPIMHRLIDWRERMHVRDVAAGHGYVELPGRLARKYRNAPRDFIWQFLFPSQAIRGGYRWYTPKSTVQEALREAVRTARIFKRITPHTLRHAFCTHAMRAGNDPATVQELMGHDSLETTMIYAHGDRARGVSPMDAADIVPESKSILRF